MANISIADTLHKKIKNELTNFLLKKIQERKKHKRQEAQQEDAGGKISNLSEFFMFMICCIGLLYHLYVITEQYLAYEMVTSTYVKSPDIIIPPAITICMRLKDFIGHLPQNCTKNELNECVLEKYSLHDLMKKYSGNLTENMYFFNFDIDHFYDGNEDINVYLRSKTLQYYFDEHKCVRIKCLLKENLNLNVRYNQKISDNVNTIERRLLENSLRQLYLIDTYLWIKGALNDKYPKYPSKLIEIKILLHEQDTIAHNRDASSITYVTEPYARKPAARLIYNQVATEYLKYPFAHACYNYKKDEKFESRGDCREKCMRDGILRKYGKSGRCLSTSDFDKTVPDIGNCEDDQIDTGCTTKCPLDCNTIQYTPMVAFRFAYKYSNTIRIQLSSIYPQTFVNFSPNFNIVSYLVYAGGIFGIWIGLDIFSSVSFLLKYFVSLIQK